MDNLQSDKLMTNKCTSLHIIEKTDGLLRKSNPIQFSCNAWGSRFDVTISQVGNRETTISSDKETESTYFISVFQDIEKLCMLFDGEFLALCSCEFFLGDDLTEWSKALSDLFAARRLALYTSADYTRATNRLGNPLDFISSELFERWVEVQYELQITHPMVLYAMSSVPLPVDLRTAILIQSLEPLFELIRQKFPDFCMAPAIEHGNERDSSLRRKIKAIILKYGRDVFPKEIEKSPDDFSHVLVTSRNRIAHIKTKENKLHLGKCESVLYCSKISLLYRHIILSLLGVDYSCYRCKMQEIVDHWDSWEGVLHFFLKTKWTDTTNEGGND